MIKNYFKIAFRGFWKHKLFTLINIVGLSVGISASLVIYLIVHYDFSFDKFHHDGDRIYRVVSNFSFSGDPVFNGGVRGPMGEAVHTQVTGVEMSAPFFTLPSLNIFVPGNGGVPVKFKNQDNVVLADGRYFKLFNDYNWLAGNSKSALEAPNQVVITSDQAKKYFPSLSYDNVIGRVVTYDTIKATVTGVVEKLKENSDFTFHDFLSYSTGTVNKDLAGQLQLKEWGGTTSASQLFVKLSAVVGVAKVEAQLNQIIKKNTPQSPDNKGNKESLSLQPLSELHFDSRYGNFDYGSVANRVTDYGLLVIAAFLLLLGCINFVNLTTAQATQRAKEIGIRKTMGSSRRQLVIQFLSETFLVTLFAVVISIAMTPAILKLFSDFVLSGVKADFIHQPGLIIFLLALTITVSLLSGFYPAIVLSGYKPVSVLKNQSVASTSKTRNATLRKSLTIAQFVIAQFFIMATAMVSKQIYYALHKDLGFKKDAIVYVNTPWKGDMNRRWVFMNKIRTLPQIEQVSMGAESPASTELNTTSAIYTDGKKEIKVNVQRKRGDANFINIYKIKLLSGRNFYPSDTLKSLLINKTYARMLGFKNPADAIGKVLKYNGSNKTVIGVVSDFHQSSLHDPFRPIVIIYDPNNSLTLHIALKPQTASGNEWQTTIASMQKSWKEIYPDDDFDYHFFDESIAKFYESEQHTSTLLTWATGLSIFISCLGLLGLAIYTTNQRTKEIGVRKVLGATVTQIVTLLSTELVLLILLAFVLVTPIAWYAMNKWMEGFADRTPISWWIFAASGAGMLLAAVFTSSFQTVKAAIANPVKSLRSE